MTAGTGVLAVRDGVRFTFQCVVQAVDKDGPVLCYADGAAAI